MAKSHITACLLTLASVCHADEWTTEQKTIAYTYAVAHVVDWGQTRTIAKNPQRWRELNPVLGRHPSVDRVNVYFLLAPVIGYVIADSLSSEHRTWALRAITAIQIVVVSNNIRAGIHVSFLATS